jgi:hypothetical protein
MLANLDATLAVHKKLQAALTGSDRKAMEYPIARITTLRASVSSAKDDTGAAKIVSTWALNAIDGVDSKKLLQTGKATSRFVIDCKLPFQAF